MIVSLEEDVRFMEQALASAKSAFDHDDVPVGCVVVLDGQIVGTGENRREIDRDPVAHAEIIALRQATKNLTDWRLQGATVYVTLEPCVMCAGALIASRVSRVVYGASEEKTGAAGSRYNLFSDPRLLHEINLTAGVLAKESAELLGKFFSERR
jgi:tRNA(adenine34) deaminase